MSLGVTEATFEQEVVERSRQLPVAVDANQRLAGLFQVQGIPAVKAFRDAKVVDESTARAYRRKLSAALG